MSKRSPRLKLYEWCITRVTADAFIGYVVEAPDAEQAIKIATRNTESPARMSRRGWPRSG